MAINPLGINNGTQAYINFDLTGTVNTQVVNIGTISGNLPGGSVAVTSIPDTPGGTLGLITRVGNLGTLEVGTISSLPNIPGGSIAVTSGTIASGSIRVVAGTVGGAAGTAAALSGNPVPVGGVTAGGTVYGLLVDSSGVLQVNGTVSTGGAGTQASRIIDGTVTRVSNIGTLEVGTISSIIPGVGATNLGKAEDAAHTSGDTGVMLLAVRNDANNALADADGDYIPLRASSSGDLRVIGDTAHDSVDAGRPIKIGGKASSSAPTNVANADRVDAYFDLAGRQAVFMDSGTVTTGSIVVTNGTIAAHAVTAATITEGTLRNLISGTINAATAILNSGTINVGTFVNNGGTQGLFNPRSPKTLISYSTVSAGTIGTIVSAQGAGTSIWVTSLDVSSYSGTVEPVVSFNLAASGTGVLVRGQFGAQGGIAKTYTPANNGNQTNAALTWNILSGSGTVAYNVTYFVEP